MNRNDFDPDLRDQAEALAHVGSFAAGIRPGTGGYWSAEARRIFGVTPEAETDAGLFWSLVHEDDRELLSRARAAAAAERGTFDATYRIRRVSDGALRWVRSRVRPVFDDGGVFVQVLGVVQDMTEARLARDELHASHVRFARLFQSGIVGVIISDASGAVLEANDAYLAMIGYSRDELERGLVRWADITPPDHRPGNELAAVQLKERGVARTWEKEYFRKDGTRVPVMLSAAKLAGDQSIVIINDLTERKRAEAALRRSEEKLAQAQKLEAIGLLAGGVAHDFNNLLSVILSYSEILASDLEASNPMVAGLEEIAHAGRRAAELTQHLLAFSRKQVLAPRATNLGEMLVGLERMLRSLIGDRIALTIDAAPRSLKTVEVDAGQIERVIVNLVVNARDAMPSGGSIVIEAANADVDASRASSVMGLRPGPYVQISVRDTGDGMSPETVARIFEPFFTMKAEGKGTGLGLSSALGIVQQSGGAISVESELGRGTTFRVYLPVYFAESSKEKAHLSGSAPAGGGETILLVEDEDRVRKMVRTVLGRYGYKVLEASHGSDALLRCEQYEGTIHAVLSDVVMPVMSGPQLGQRLRAVRPQTRILFMSGYAAKDAGHFGAGVAFIQKPFTPDTLLSALRAVLDAPG